MHTTTLLSATILGLTALVTASPMPSWEDWAHPKGHGKGWKKPEFTSMFHVVATPDTIINGTAGPVPGEKGALGYYNLYLNSKTEVICYDIILEGVSGTPKSPAKTATHLHNNSTGKAGPPRISFPDPVGDDKFRRSSGCLQGPFTTGLNNSAGVDTGVGFTLAMVEANPSMYYADSHTNKYVPGAVRGQLA